MKISIITPTFNRKKYLLDNINSVAELVIFPQNAYEIDHIIYDDGSTDGTEELFKENKYKNLRYFRNKKNKGPSFARNEAIKLSNADFIFCLDSDDLILPLAIYNFSLYFSKPRFKKSPHIYISNYLKVDKELRYLQGIDKRAYTFDKKINSLNSIFYLNKSIQHNVLFSREEFNKVGGYDNEIKIGEDMDLFLKMIINGSDTVYCMHDSFLQRDHGENLTSNLEIESHNKRLSVLYLKHKQYLSKYINPLKTNWYKYLS